MNCQLSGELLHNLFEHCASNLFFFHDQNDKIVGGDYQETNKCLDGKKIFSNPKAKNVTTPFIQK